MSYLLFNSTNILTVTENTYGTDSLIKHLPGHRKHPTLVTGVMESAMGKVNQHGNYLKTNLTN